MSDKSKSDIEIKVEVICKIIIQRNSKCKLKTYNLINKSFELQ